MNITLQSDAMRELMQRLANLSEADANQSIVDAPPEAANAVPAAATAANSTVQPAAAPEPGTEDQTQDDAEIDSVMTEPRDPNTEDKAKITVASLAADLGIKNTALFKTAFNSLRSGQEPTDADQLKELAAAFTKLMSTDTNTAPVSYTHLTLPTIYSV